MSTDINHTIQKYIFELDVSGSGPLMNWENKAHQYSQEILIPELEKSFTKFAKEDRYVVIDKLEIDLGTFLPADFENDVLIRLIEFCNEYLKKLGNNRTKEENVKPSMQIDKRKESNASVESDQENIKELNPITARYLAFVNYLKLGRFPWWYEDRSKSLKMEDQFPVSWINSLGIYERESLKTILQSNTRTRIRLANNFVVDWIGELIEVIEMHGKEAIEQWKMLYPLLNNYFKNEIIFHQQFWNSWIQSYTQDARFSNLIILLGFISKSEKKSMVKLKTELINLCKQNLRNNNYPEHSRFLLSGLKENIVSQKAIPDKKNNIRAGDNREEIKPGNTNYITDTLNASESKLLNEFSDNREKNATINDIGTKTTPQDDLLIQHDDRVIYVEGAGLVLLHPFLQELFKERQLWIKDHWQSDVSVHYAVQLLSLLSFGEDPAKEHQLLIHKILAGLELDTLLHNNISLLEEDKKVCDELLKACIRHWKALRNTSPQGLQATFIQRVGKLTTGDEKYLLQIENKTEDILLSHLPWGYGTIKLPWMQRILHVNWI